MVAIYAVESNPRKLSGAWVFKDTRMPVLLAFENVEPGATIDEIIECHELSRAQIVEALEFAARGLDGPLSRDSLTPA